MGKWLGSHDRHDDDPSFFIGPFLHSGSSNRLVKDVETKGKPGSGDLEPGPATRGIPGSACGAWTASILKGIAIAIL